MMKNPSRILLSLTVALAAGATALPAAAARPDGWLTAKTKIALLTARDADGTDIHVDTVRGRVILHGKVESEAEKARAEQIARKIDGVIEVRNMLQVVPDASKKAVKASDEQIKREIETALKSDVMLSDSDISVRSVNQGMVLLGGKAASTDAHLRAVQTARLVSGVRQVESEVNASDELADARSGLERKVEKTSADASRAMSDLWVTSAVKMRLIASPEVPATEVNVDTHSGKVTLFGVVPSAAARSAAEVEARKVDGVKSVVNDLQVVPRDKQEATKHQDADVQKEVERLLKSEGDLRNSSINVEVKDGVVRLTGTVASENARFVAAMTARTVAGVRAVREELQVKTERAAR